MPGTHAAQLGQHATTAARDIPDDLAGFERDAPDEFVAVFDAIHDDANRVGDALERAEAIAEDMNRERPLDENPQLHNDEVDRLIAEALDGQIGESELDRLIDTAATAIDTAFDRDIAAEAQGYVRTDVDAALAAADRGLDPLAELHDVVTWSPEHAALLTGPYGRAVLRRLDPGAADANMRLIVQAAHEAHGTGNLPRTLDRLRELRTELSHGRLLLREAVDAVRR